MSALVSVSDLLTGDNNTTVQRIAIDGRINLADGHARQDLHAFELDLVERASEIFHEVWPKDYSSVENAFLDRFYELGGQRRPDHVLLSYSVSSLVQSIAIHLRRNHRRVCYAEPCFDNFVDLVANVGVETTRIGYPDLPALLGTVPDFDVLWVVAPGNPDGQELDEDLLGALAEHCERHDVLLVVDCCFRLFSPRMTSWCQYSVLDESGVSYVVLEDTGKVFPFLDLKVGMLAASADVLGALHELNRDLLLNVSPWVLELLGRGCTGAAEMGLEDYLWRGVRRNREGFLGLTDGLLHDLAPESTVPLLWLELTPEVPFDAVELRKHLTKSDVHVLDGRYFYAERDRGARRLRVAISRSTPSVLAAAERVVAAIGELRG
ncbi:aminotransferase class I/II-fold pyridoxal phosphate-dependent enzyme [Allokutzneria sp. A3M-2-11 16]|uniref:aminotransferase class I/II-fold pyridoxal phosphate-dependent enzyme n=1 Tax=Allokutzneria sp. A3M-2-11 16 TaxID=2962043 RepID=UPI0020B7F8D2|nr:aminotransferase class I/II-fold pyridoxal phosphate-dependent enzyme [Allokutzneria sp. A3M-2-11 16]MCP3802375.1 aminotransferase class I/II-fold pyridoxal phosphate-dependent enzyme [Allokutzneria sp. A3M-2-11 16]